MSSEIRQLEPQQLWNKFADLNAVPRASKKEERVIAFIKDFGKKSWFRNHRRRSRQCDYKKTSHRWNGKSCYRSDAIAFRYGAPKK